MPGVFERSSDFVGASSWVGSPITVDGTNALVSAWESDDKQKVGDAQMWTMNNQIANSASNTPIPLRKQLFLRAGREWKTSFDLNFGTDLDTVQLSFLENAGTRGDEQGTIPVIRFDPVGPSWSPGVHVMTVTLKYPISVSLALKADATTSGDQSMMEMDWVGVGRDHGGIHMNISDIVRDVLIRLICSRDVANCLAKAETDHQWDLCHHMYIKCMDGGNNPTGIAGSQNDQF